MKNPTYADAQAVAAEVMRRFDAGEFDVAHLAYSNFRSVLVQEPIGRADHPGQAARRQRRRRAGVAVGRGRI